VLLKAQAVNVQRLVLLRGAHIVEERAGGDGGGGMIVEAEALQSAHIQLALDERNGKVAGPDPVLDARAGLNPVKLRRKLGAGGR
jgi:hypothetical protein